MRIFYPLTVTFNLVEVWETGSCHHYLNIHSLYQPVFFSLKIQDNIMLLELVLKTSPKIWQPSIRFLATRWSTETTVHGLQHISTAGFQMDFYTIASFFPKQVKTLMCHQSIPDLHPKAVSSNNKEGFTHHKNCTAWLTTFTYKQENLFRF